MDLFTFLFCGLLVCIGLTVAFIFFANYSTVKNFQKHYASKEGSSYRDHDGGGDDEDDDEEEEWFRKHKEAGFDDQSTVIDTEWRDLFGEDTAKFFDGLNKSMEGGKVKESENKPTKKSHSKNKNEIKRVLKIVTENRRKTEEISKRTREIRRRIYAHISAMIKHKR